MSPLDCRDITERKIREAWKAGHFDDLPGRGRPLDLRENPFVKPEWRLAHRIIANAGFTPDWIELNKTIRAEAAQCRKLLEDQLLWANKALSSPDDRQEIDVELDDVYHWTIDSYTQRATRLNEKIEIFNLMVPLMRLQKHKVLIGEELREFRERWLQKTQRPNKGFLIPSTSPKTRERIEGKREGSITGTTTPQNEEPRNAQSGSCGRERRSSTASGAEESS